MAKKNPNKFGSPHIPAAPVITGASRSSLEKLVPVWSASFESASRVYQSFDVKLDIQIDQDWLHSVIERLQGDTHLVRWIEQFADVCRELTRFKERLHDECSERWNAANLIASDAELSKQAVTDLQQTLELARADLQRGKAHLASEQQVFAIRKSELLDTERSLSVREANAQANFLEQNEEALRQLEDRKLQLARQCEAQLQQLQEEKRKLDAELSQTARRLAEVKFNCTEEEAERIRQLDQREHEIKQSKIELDRARSRLDREWADIKAAEDGLEQRIAAEMDAERVSHAQDISRLERQRDNAWNKAEELKEKWAEIQELRQALGEQSGAEILEQLETLKQNNRALRRDLEQSDATELHRENEYLRSSKADLERDISVIRPELDELRREMSSKRVASTELEAVAREKRVLEQHKNTLAVHIDDLESRIQQLTNSQKTQTPFPAMSLMDSDREYRARMELDEVPDLKVFAEQLQHRIARAEEHVELFYPLEDIRVLLGGLAMSQLHVFQGISGTGKTSLANHDETTNELADKTYDRAHVMTLPKQDHRFEIKGMEPASYSYRSLRKAFTKARADHREEVVELLQRLTGDAFTEQLGSRFALGWGNRFEKQALDFIPVMLACGASSGEALDHLLSTRVMRQGKVTGRYNVGVEAVRNLRGALEDFWVEASLYGEPQKSIELLDADIRRLDGRH